jgi:hypothetical protein
MPFVLVLVLVMVVVMVTVFSRGLSPPTGAGDNPESQTSQQCASRAGLTQQPEQSLESGPIHDLPFLSAGRRPSR